uniref:Uncharacterized protein n=1 Tax=Acrobeloides nanus TaxID=290746 RepID=A0A914D7X4_9BILA
MISCKKASLSWCILLTVWFCSICNACIPTSGGGDCCREGGGQSCCQPQTQIQVSCASCSQDSVESYQQPAPQYHPMPFYQPPVEYQLPAQYQPPVLPQQPILVQPNSLDYQAQPPAYGNAANPPAPQQQTHSLTDDSMFPFVQQPAQDRVHSPSAYMEVPPPTLPPSPPLFPTEKQRPPSAQHQVDPSEQVNYVSELPLTPPANPPGTPTPPPSLHLFPTENPRPPCAQQQVEPSEQVDDMHEAPSTSANFVSELPLTPPANPPENPFDESNLHMIVSENKDDQPNNLDINMLPNTLPHGSTNGDDYDGPKSNITPEQREYSMGEVSTSPLSMASGMHAIDSSPRKT